MTYNVFGGTLNLAQSINRNRGGGIPGGEVRLKVLHSARDGVMSLILAASYVFVATTLVYRRSIALYAFIISRYACRIEESWTHEIQQGITPMVSPGNVRR